MRGHVAQCAMGMPAGSQPLATGYASCAVAPTMPSSLTTYSSGAGGEVAKAASPHSSPHDSPGGHSCSRSLSAPATSPGTVLAALEHLACSPDAPCCCAGRLKRSWRSSLGAPTSPFSTLAPFLPTASAPTRPPPHASPCPLPAKKWCVWALACVLGSGNGSGCRCGSDSGSGSGRELDLLLTSHPCFPVQVILGSQYAGNMKQGVRTPSCMRPLLLRNPWRCVLARLLRETAKFAAAAL